MKERCLDMFGTLSCCVDCVFAAEAVYTVSDFTKSSI